MAIAFIAIGLCSGVLSGMGLGGGLIMLPALTILMSVGHLAAQGFNLLAFLPAAAAAVIQYARQGNIQWQDVLLVGSVAILGAVGGALLAGIAEEGWLRTGYALLLMVFGVHQIVTTKQ